MSRLVQIKLGGSLITDKSKPYTSRPEVIRRLAIEISQAQKITGDQYILGNGAGSFAHTSASRYDTANGFTTEEGKRGYCIVQFDATTLNHMCVKIFMEEGIDTISIPPSSIMTATSGKLDSIFVNSIQQLIQKNITPFVFGDAISDKVRGSVIFSCDQVMEYLSKNMKTKPSLILSVGDFPGVLDENNLLVKEIDLKKFDLLSKNGALKPPKTKDVTGGMKEKIRTLLTLAQIGIETVILDGREEGNLFKALTQSDTPGTKIIS